MGHPIYPCDVPRLAGIRGGAVGFLENIGGWELVVIVLLGVFIFGPDRLPKAISDGVRMVRQLREMARNATGDLNRELGTTIELEDLNPKTFLRKHLLSEEDEQALRRPLANIYDELRDDLRGVQKSAADIASAINTTPAQSVAAQSGPAESSPAKDVPGPPLLTKVDNHPAEAHLVDDDAT